MTVFERALKALAVLACLAGAPLPAAAEIAVKDQTGRTVTLAEPARRIVLTEGTDLLALSLIDDDPASKVVGWNPARFDAGTLAALRASAPAIDGFAVLTPSAAGGLSMEKIVALSPDLVLLHPYYFEAGGRRSAEVLEAAGIAVAVLDVTPQIRDDDPVAGLKLLGRLTGNEEKAEEFAAFYGARLGRIRERVEAVPAGARPRVLVEAHAGRRACCISTGRGVGIGDLVGFAGGRNIGADIIPGTIGELSAEFVLSSAPEVYIATGGAYLAEAGGMTLGVGHSAADASRSLETVTRRPVIAELPAVRNGRAHGVWMSLTGVLNLVAIEAFARWLHPALFTDVDPQATLEEINGRFLATPLHGAFLADLPGGPADGRAQ